MVLLRVLLRVPQTNFDILLAYEVRGLKTTPCSSLRSVKPIFFSLRKMLFLPPDVAETRGSHTGTVNPKLRRGAHGPQLGPRASFSSWRQPRSPFCCTSELRYTKNNAPCTEDKDGGNEAARCSGPWVWLALEPGPRGLLTGDLGPQKGSMGPQGEKRAGTSLFLLPRENREDPRVWDRTDSSQAPQGRGAWTGLRAPGPCPPAEPRHLPGGSGPGRGPAGMRRAGRLLEAGILSFIDSLIPDSAGENALGPRGTSLKAWRAGWGPPTF